VVFVVAKIAFMLFCGDGHSYGISDVCQVVLHGLSLDLSTALYFLIVPFVLSIVQIWYWHQWLDRLLKGYFLIISLAFALAFVADTSLYPFWGFKLNASCLQYLESPNEMAASVSTMYLVWRFVALVIATIVIFDGYRHKFPVRMSMSIKQKLKELAIYILCIPLMVIGIRGGVSESTTNTGQVFYSQQLFLNHAAVNPVFSFLSSFEHGEDDYYHYNYFETNEVDDILKDVYTTESVDIDTLLTTQRPNVIVILLESCGAVFTELGGHPETMPRFSQIAAEGISFTQCYGNSWRTDRGTVCTLSGWPSFPNVSVMKMPDKSQTMPSIAKTLKQAHYQTHYLYGGDINFTNMRGYLMATGWDKLTSMDDYPKSQRTSEWGVPDDITFETVYQMATSAQQPFLIGYSTLSSHEPWEVPVQQFDDKIQNAFYYLDQCIGTFIDKLKQSEAWQNTLVVMLPDHGIQYQQLDETMPLRNLIPVVWTGGAVKTAKRIDKICNQSDIAATLLGQMGLPHDDFTFSRDVLSNTYRYPMAVHNYNNAQSMIDSTGFILYDFDASRFIKRDSKDAERMLKVSKAILQKTTNDLKER
jgi:phosphoglycerol transferase MdoB-like AlkP superfamily enzyme